MSTTIGQLFEQTVQKYPEREALVDTRLDKRWTFREWNEVVNRLANALLEAGVKKGDRVSTYLYNTSEMGTILFACAKIGAVFNPINFRLKADELSYILNNAEPKIIFFEEALTAQVTQARNGLETQPLFWSINDHPPEYAANFYEKIALSSDSAPMIEINENDLYAIMYTSGTTGRPKGVMHRHRDMVEQSLALIGAMQLTQHDRGLVMAPMFHCAELHCAFLPRVQAGACSIILHHFEPERALETILNEKITTLFGAPTMWSMMLQQNLENYDLSSLRNSLYGGAPMAPALVRKCKEAVNIQLIQAYGMTEMGPAITFLMDEDQLKKAGAAGQAIYNHEVRVVKPNENGPSEPDDILEPGDIGEIIVKGNSLMAGYFHRDDATAEAMYKGWYHSGDLGYFDRDGFLFVADRVDDMVISGGENIYPREVEDLLFEHDGVLDAAVLGEPDAKWGERVIAYIKKKDPALTAEDLEAFCKSNGKLANYKRPRRYIFVDELPRNASGKLQKFLLREQLANQS
ncbi:fatty-acyl-CoA synthase [Scopulibacillus darangshiensis]|uniref:Fatty-acyl-CoA synthase n=1 Tax=Scopulibacillus darangshiensis TaxID=442528 RepID=A0A4V2SKV4_9BACL|nr:fatty acid--CoA ligase [Scopulibacillus darangshiensis]TCP20876.1 fatty-acyl-CoA synthase [Scopulibacillus darangshiensis]